MKLPTNNRKGKSFAHIQKPLIDGIRFKSKMEAHLYQYFKWCEDRGLIRGLQYEPITFWFPIMGGTTSYKPDFWYFDNEAGKLIVTEVKGYMDPKSNTKLTRMKKYYPKIEVRLVASREYRGIIKTTKKLIKYI